MAFITGTLNLLAFVAWLGLMAFLYAVGGARPWEQTTFVLYCGPLAYFAICFVTTLPGVRGATMLALGVVAHLLLLPFVVFYLSQGLAALLFVVPFVVLSALWYATYRATRR